MRIRIFWLITVAHVPRKVSSTCWAFNKCLLNEQSIAIFVYIMLPKSLSYMLSRLSASWGNRLRKISNHRPAQCSSGLWRGHGRQKHREHINNGSSQMLETVKLKHISFWFVLDSFLLTVNPLIWSADSTPKSFLFCHLVALFLLWATASLAWTMLSLLTCLPASRIMIFSSLKCEPNNITPLRKILQRFRIPCMKSAIFCVICKIVQGLAPAHLFSLISCHSPRLHLLKSTYFSPTGHFSLDPKSCPCPSL